MDGLTFERQAIQHTVILYPLTAGIASKTDHAICRPSNSAPQEEALLTYL